MAQKKLYRFARIKTFENVLEYPELMKGKWKAFFKNEHPVKLELACGRGEYTIGLARLHPDENFIGVDVKGNRMYIGAKTALDEGLSNAAFLRTQIEQIDQYFSKGEVEEIWITFPDPQLRNSKAKKRLTHPRFLRLYNNILKPDGLIHLKTDSPQLYNFTLLVCELYGITVIQNIPNVLESSAVPELMITTHYQSMDIAQSKQIYYLSFSLPDTLPMDDTKLKDAISDAAIG